MYVTSKSNLSLEKAQTSHKPCTAGWQCGTFPCALCFQKESHSELHSCWQCFLLTKQITYTNSRYCFQNIWWRICSENPANYQDSHPVVLNGCKCNSSQHDMGKDFQYLVKHVTSIKHFNCNTGVSISTDVQRRASASLIRDVGYLLPKLK